MSWRRFSVLLKALSRNSVLIQLLQSREKEGETISDPKKAEKAVETVWGL